LFALDILSSLDKFKRPIGYVVGITKPVHLTRPFIGFVRGNPEGNKGLRRGTLFSLWNCECKCFSLLFSLGGTSSAVSSDTEATPRKKKHHERMSSKSDADNSNSESEFSGMSDFSEAEDDLLSSEKCAFLFSWIVHFHCFHLSFCCSGA